MRDMMSLFGISESPGRLQRGQAGTDGRRLLALSLLRYGVVLCVLVAVVIAAGLATGAYEAFYAHCLVGPRVRREFGFDAGWIRVEAASGEPREWYAITHVVEGGVMAKAGFRDGDIPLECYHGCIKGFYFALAAAREGYPVEIRIVAASDYAKGPGAARRLRLGPQ